MTPYEELMLTMSVRRMRDILKQIEDLKSWTEVHRTVLVQQIEELDRIFRRKD